MFIISVPEIACHQNVRRKFIIGRKKKTPNKPKTALYLGCLKVHKDINGTVFYE